MGDEGTMAATNFKRYLQNKLGYRKRRRPNSVLLDPAKVVNEGSIANTSLRLRQTTRQPVQRHLPTRVNNFPCNKMGDAQGAEISKMITTTAMADSKNYLRSNKLEIDQLQAHERCSPSHFHPINFKDLDSEDVISSAMCLDSGNKCDCQKKLDNNKNETDAAEVNNITDAADETNELNERDESLCVTYHMQQCPQYGRDATNERIKPQNDERGDEENNCSCSATTSRSSLSFHTGREFACYSDLGCETNVPRDIFEIKNVQQKGITLNHKFRTEYNGEAFIPKIFEHSEHESNFPKSTAHDIAGTTSIETPSNFSPSRTQFIDSREDKPQEHNEISLIHLSDKLCSDASFTSASSCKTSFENHEEFVVNKSKHGFNENPSTSDNRQHTSPQSQLLFQHPNIQDGSSLPDNTKDSLRITEFDLQFSSEYEKKHSCNTVENRNTSSKSPTPISTPAEVAPLNKQVNQHSINDKSSNSKLENLSFQQNTLKNGPVVVSSILILKPNDCMKKETLACNSPNNNTSINSNIISLISSKSDCTEKNVRIDQQHLDQHIKQSSDLPEEEQINQSERLSKQKYEEESFYQYIKPNVRAEHTEYNIQQDDNIIINAAENAYAQSGGRCKQKDDTTIASPYKHMANNKQNELHDYHSHQKHELEHVHRTHQQMDAQEHSMEHRYSVTEQMYCLQRQQQEDVQQRYHVQYHQTLKHDEVQLQLTHNDVSRNTMHGHRQERGSGQEHSHHQLDFLYPQHCHPTHSPLNHQKQQPVHEVYHDLVMEEFHDERYTSYKLGLSPSTVKHENQDDGYETSAGDVLTPNSHVSSTHSVTPQNHLQHTSSSSLVSSMKCEDQQQQQQCNIQLQQQILHDTHLLHDRLSNNENDLEPNETTTRLSPRDPHHFLDDGLNSSGNNGLRGIQESRLMNDFMLTQPSNILNSANRIYHQQHLQKQSCMDSNNTLSTMTNADTQRLAVTKQTSSHHNISHDDSILTLQTKAMQKKRGRKKKMLNGSTVSQTLERTNFSDVNSVAGFKERKKHDRFNGMSEDEVVKRILPDHLCENLDIVIIGINPGLFAAYKGHHYAGPGNHFWKCLYLSGLTQEQMNADEDFKLLKYGIGFTNMVQRATKGSADLTRREIKEGSRILLEKLQRFRPKIAVFNGKLIFEVFSGKKDFNFGRQPEYVEGTDTYIWVMPSSSARCAQLPRAADKVPFYAALKKFRDYLNGLIPNIDQSECVFTEERIRQQCEQENYRSQQNNPTLTYTNPISIPNSDSPFKARYSFDSETIQHGASGGPGPPHTESNVNYIMSPLEGAQAHTRKKRGRPKKIKGQEFIDPVTGNKIQINSKLMTPRNGKYVNILNLSLMQGSNSEMPKKKRGRPKKVKPQSNILQTNISQSPQSSTQTKKPNIMSIQVMTSGTDPPTHIQGLQKNHQHMTLYSTPPPHQMNIYSPMASPSLHSSYTTKTPPSQSNYNSLPLIGNARQPSNVNTTDLVSPGHNQHSIQPEQNFGGSPPQNSPSICAVDFEPPIASTASSPIVSENINHELSTIRQRSQSTEKSCFNSPIGGQSAPNHNINENYQQWLSPQHNHNVHSPSAGMFSNSSQQPSLNYQSQQQMQAIQQHQESFSEWPLRHVSRYEDLSNSPYLLASSHFQQTHSHRPSHHYARYVGHDVTRKSLSGLESLVDQIPTISESESIALSSPTAINAQAAENRQQAMQNSSLNDSQETNDSHFSNSAVSSNFLTTNNRQNSENLVNDNHVQQPEHESNMLNNSFPVNSLATTEDSYYLSSNYRPVENNNAYHHSNLMAAVIAAAANSPANLETPLSVNTTATHHTETYMDSHAHLTTHVAVNSIYSQTTPHHPAIAVHHHAAAVAAHYGSTQHSSIDYAATNNPYATQTNVTTGHTLHMPSPSYAYGYSTASSQNSYSAYPHTYGNHHHAHPHAHSTAHRLSMFDHLKPSDINGYNSGFC